MYALSLLKNDNIRSTSKLIRVMKDVMKDKDSLIEHKNFIKPFIENIPNEVRIVLLLLLLLLLLLFVHVRSFM